MAGSPILEVVAALVAGGVGLPIPEELALVTAGYFIGRGEPWLPMCLAALAAVLAGDLVMYVAGRGARFGMIRRTIGETRILRLEHVCEKHGPKVLLVARFVPGLRAALLVAAGAGRVPLARFLACDGAAALAGAALWISVGHALGPRIDEARAIVANARGLVLVAAAAAGVVALGWSWWSKRSRAARPRRRRPRRIQSDVAASGDGGVQSR